MDVVGRRMREGECFIPEVLLSARTMQGALELLKPRLAEGDSGNLGTIVIGTVEGDVHDIGKNLVAMMLEGAGFTVDEPRYGHHTRPVRGRREGASAGPPGHERLADDDHPEDGRHGQGARGQGLRDGVKVVCGGAPVTQAFVDSIGADGYGPNAAAAVDLAKLLVH